MARAARRLIAGTAALTACVGVVTTPVSGHASPHHQPAYLQVIAHPDDDLLFMSPDLARGIRAGDGVTTLILTAAEGHAGLGTDAHDVWSYITERRQGLQAAYAAMAGVRDDWRVRPVRSGAAKIEVHTLAGRPNVRLAFLGLPDGRDPRAALGRRSVAQLLSSPGSGECARAMTPANSPYAFCYTHEDVVRAIGTMLQTSGATVIRAQDPAPDRRYTLDHTDHVAASRFAAEAARASGRRIAEVDYRDYNLSDTPANLSGADGADKRRFFGTYRFHDYRINPEASNYNGWQERMRYRFPRGASWADTGPDGRPRAFAVLSGGLYVWWQTATGWHGPQYLGGQGLSPTVSVSGGLVFTLRDGRVSVVRPRPSGGGWATTWTTLSGRVVGAPVPVQGPHGTLALFARDALGGVSARCLTPPAPKTTPKPPKAGAAKRPGSSDEESHRSAKKPPHDAAKKAPRKAPKMPVRKPSAAPSRTPATPPRKPSPGASQTPARRPGTAVNGVWRGAWVRLAVRGTAVPPRPAKKVPGLHVLKPKRPIPDGNDVQDGIAAVGGPSGIEVFAPTRTKILQWRQVRPCGFGYAGVIPAARPGGPLSAARDAAGDSVLLFDADGTTSVQQMKETGRTWSTPATPLAAVFHQAGEPPAPTGSRVPPPAPHISTIGVPAVVTDAEGEATAIALGADGLLYTSARDGERVFGAWAPAR